jgi:hypothetical protein
MNAFKCDEPELPAPHPLMLELCTIFLSRMLCAMIATNRFTLACTPILSSGAQSSCGGQFILPVGGRSFWAAWLGRLL